MAESLFSYSKIEKPSKFLAGTLTVMFVDIVQFTKFGDNEKLREVVRGLQNAIMDVFSDLEWDMSGPVTQNDVVMMPTGDGYGIAFEPNRTDDRVVLDHAADLSRRLKREGTPIRTGISKGPCYVHKDINNKLNIAGWGIIDAQRAMSCGEMNHILCTQVFAKSHIDATGESHLHEIGNYSVKDRKVSLFNYYSSSFGNKKNPPKR